MLIDLRVVALSPPPPPPTHTHTHRYMDDIPHIEGELYAGLVFSTHAHANITVDFSKAVSIPGVKGYVGVDDVPGDNATGIKNCFVCRVIGC